MSKRNLQRPASGEAVELEADAQELVGHLDRAMRRLMWSGRERLPMERFSHSEIIVLDTLGAEGGLAMSALAARARMPLSTATRVVDRLVARDMLERERLAENRRVVRVKLGRGGHRVYQMALRGRIAGMQRMLAPLTENERRALIRLFQKIADSTAEGSAR